MHRCFSWGSNSHVIICGTGLEYLPSPMQGTIHVTVDTNHPLEILKESTKGKLNITNSGENFVRILTAHVYLLCHLSCAFCSTRLGR